MHNPFVHNKHCSFHLRVLYILTSLFLMIGCSSHKNSKRIITTNDTIGYNCIAYWVHGYMCGIGEIPTKEEFLEYNDVGDAMESYLGIKGEHLEKIISDTLYQELDYTEIFQCTSAWSIEPATPRGIFIASNYLLTHPTIQFINQDSCLLVVDSTVYEHDSSIVSFTVPMPEIMIKDSAFYYRGVKLSSIKECDNKVFYEVCQNTTPILVDYDSPVDLIDTLITYFGGKYIRTKPFGRSKEERIVMCHSRPWWCETNGILNMPVYEFSDSLYIEEYIEEENTLSEKEKQKMEDARMKDFVDKTQHAKMILHRRNDTIYLNGEPVNDSCRIDPDEYVLIDLTLDNTYRDVCEIARFLLKAKYSKSFSESPDDVRLKCFFKSDDEVLRTKLLLEELKYLPHHCPVDTLDDGIKYF